MVSAEREHLGGNQAIPIKWIMRIPGIAWLHVNGVAIFVNATQVNKCAEMFKQNNAQEWGGNQIKGRDLFYKINYKLAGESIPGCCHEH